MLLYTCVVGLLLLLHLHCMRPVKYDMFFVHLAVCRITHNIAQKVCLKLLFIFCGCSICFVFLHFSSLVTIR
jgi:hypothetical protein